MTRRPDHADAPSGGADGSSRAGLPGRSRVKQGLLVLCAVATVYAAALLLWGGDGSAASLGLLWSWTGVQALGLCLLNYLLRGLRWRLWMAHFGRHFGLLQGLRLYVSGYAFTPTPGNIGEAARTLMLAHQPLGTGQSLAIFGAERLADLLCLLLLTLPAAAWLLRHARVQQAIEDGLPFSVMLAVVAGLFLVALLVAAWLFIQRRAWCHAWVLHRFAWLEQAWQCLALRPALWLALSLTAWAAQGLALWLLCRALDVHLPVLTAMAFYAVAMVAGALSALPAGLGSMEAVLAGLLVAQSASAAKALTITVLIRLLSLWLAVAIGVAALLYSAAIAKDIRFS